MEARVREAALREQSHGASVRRRCSSGSAASRCPSPLQAAGAAIASALRNTLPVLVVALCCSAFGVLSRSPRLCRRGGAVQRRGTRRAPWICPTGFEFSEDPGGLWVAFELPEGASATVVPRERTRDDYFADGSGSGKNSNASDDQ